MTADYTQLPWQVGDDEPRIIYVVVPEKGVNLPMIGVMDTPRLAHDVVLSHNNKLNKLASSGSYGQKEKMISDLRKTLELWEKNNGNLEGAIIEAFGQSSSARRVYDAIGFSATVVGPHAEMPLVIQHAIDLIRNS